MGLASRQPVPVRGSPLGLGCVTQVGAHGLDGLLTVHTVQLGPLPYGEAFSHNEDGVGNFDWAHLRLAYARHGVAKLNGLPTIIIVRAA